MGLADWFMTFCGNLVVSNQDTISYRYKRLTKRLNTDFWSNESETSHSLYVGSYGRNTAINGFSDLDMLFQLPYLTYVQYNNHQGNGQSSLLQAVRDSINNTYSSTNIRADGQIIQIPFDDGITFELLPAFTNEDGSFTYPDANSGGSWGNCDPKSELAAMSKRNTECNGNLIKLCRMMRQWKREWNVPIKGLLIDTLAYQFIENWTYRDKSYFYYDFMSRDFLLWMSEQSSEQEYWKAPGSARYVYGKGLFQYKAKQCYNIAKETIAHEQAEREWSAKEGWRQIYGTTFPN